MSTTPLRTPNNLTNIPHMLRNLAAELERGDAPMPETLLLVAIHGTSTVPELYHFGKDGDPLLYAGAMAVTAQQMMLVDVVEK